MEDGPFPMNVAKLQDPLTALTPFKINSSKTVSKQMTLSSFKMNTYTKTRGGGCKNSNWWSEISLLAVLTPFRCSYPVEREPRGVWFTGREPSQPSRSNHQSRITSHHP